MLALESGARLHFETLPHQVVGGPVDVLLLFQCSHSQLAFYAVCNELNVLPF